MKEIQKGLYEHYKGNHYEVIGFALHSETHEEMVVYKPLYKSKFGKDMLWVRPRTMFQENVVVEGKEVPRFRYCSQ